MATTYTISDNFIVTLAGDVTITIPINPETNVPFKSYDEAETWAIKACANVVLEKSGQPKIWTPYGFLQQLPVTTLAGCIELEKAQDTKMLVFMRMLTVAKDIKSNDSNLLAFLDYCVSKNILTPEQKNEIIL